MFFESFCRKVLSSIFSSNSTDSLTTRFLISVSLELLEQPYNPKVHRFKSAKKILDFYQSCTDIKTRNKVGVGPLLDLLKKIGGWPMITKNWSDENYDWENVYVYLRSQLNVKYLIDLYVDTDTIEKTKRVIYVGLRFKEFNSRDSHVALTTIIDQITPLIAHSLMVSSQLSNSWIGRLSV